MKKLEEYIKLIAEELLDEESASGDAGGYLASRAFSKKTNEIKKKEEQFLVPLLFML